MLVKDTALIAITSPSDESTQMGSQVHAKIKGTDKFVWKLISPDKCDWCIRNPDMFEEEGCPHVVSNLPFFRSRKRIKLVESMLDEETAQQEVHGRQTGGTAEYMFRNKLQETKNLPRYVFAEEVQVLHAFVDPCAGSMKSDYVIGTVAYERGLYILVGLDVMQFVGINRNWDAAQVMIIQHCEKILTKYSHAQLFVHIEANLDFLSAGMTGQFLNAIPPPQIRSRIHVLGKNFIDKDQSAIGEWTTHAAKKRWCYDFTMVLQRNEFRICHEIVSLDPVENIKRMFEQMFFYARHLKPSLDPRFTESIETFSGKAQGRKDDCALVIQAVVSEYMKSRNEERYLKVYHSMNVTNF